MNKDASILDLLAWLEQHAGDTFQVVDHWDADLLAIGFAAPGDPSRLAYVLSLGPNRFRISLETSPPPDSELPFVEIGRWDDVDREQVLAILLQHLRTAPW